MNMVPFDSVVERVLVELTGNPPVALVRAEVVGAMAQFSEASWACHVDLAPETVFAGQASYPIDVDDPNNTRPGLLLRVAIKGHALDPIGLDEAERVFAHPVEAASTGTPAKFTRTTADEVVLLPAPAERMTGALTMRVALIPRMTATRVPDVLVEQHFDAVVHGALARMMAMSGKPWTSGDMATYHASAFNQAIEQTRNAVQQGMTRAGNRTKSRYF